MSGVNKDDLLFEYKLSGSAGDYYCRPYVIFEGKKVNVFVGGYGYTELQALEDVLRNLRVVLNTDYTCKSRDNPIKGIPSGLEFIECWWCKKLKQDVRDRSWGCITLEPICLGCFNELVPLKKS